MFDSNGDAIAYLHFLCTAFLYTAEAVFIMRIAGSYQNLHKPNAVKKRVFGQYRGQMQIADDFDDELPLDFWLGESA